jgi:hypothetical protein
MVSILVIVPTRGRPDNAKRLADAFESTVARQNGVRVDLVFAVDADDPELSGYLDHTTEYNWWTISGPRLRMAGTLNMVAIEYAGQYDIVGFLGDDHLPQTVDWHRNIARAMKPGGIVYGNDLIQGPNLPTAVFLDARIIRKLGYMVPGGFVHLFLDNVWRTWGERAGTLTYLPDTIIEHLHPIAGKAEYDDQYAEVNSNAVWTADEKRFNEYRDSGELDADVEKIRSIRG